MEGRVIVWHENTTSTVDGVTVSWSQLLSLEKPSCERGGTPSFGHMVKTRCGAATQLYAQTMNQTTTGRTIHISSGVSLLIIILI